mgnify:FL=1
MSHTYNYQTVSSTILADLYTPVGVYLSLRGLYPQSALMESSDYHSHDTARSFIAIHPMASFAVSHGVAITSLPDGTILRQPLDLDRKGVAKEQVAQALGDFLAAFHVEGEGREYCGVYGFTSFNAVRYFENIDVVDDTQPANDAPDMLYVMYRDLIVFDHYSNRIRLVTLVREGDSVAAGGKVLTDIEQQLRRPGQCYDFHTEGPVFSTLSDEAHRANIRRCVAHCLRGDVFQIVVSRRFCQRYSGDDFRLYRALRSINPSPYLFYFDFGGYRIFGSSPETHCRIDGDRAYIDPIAGTTRRTGDPAEDRRHAEFLRNDAKENAEHVMLVDLARNDLSRNCQDVKVDFFKDMQFYSHVIHLVSRVSGILDEGCDAVQAFIDTFPAGTLSGAPKVRAMQLISQYEPHCRGAYGGCVGYIGMDGSLNQTITIRTFVSRNGELWFQAGGGIVAKSDVEYELQEVNNKLGALRAAIEKAAKL